MVAESSSKEMLASTLHSIGQIHVKRDSLEEAESSFRQALVHAKHPSELRSFIVMGLVHVLLSRSATVAKKGEKEELLDEGESLLKDFIKKDPQNTRGYCRIRTKQNLRPSFSLLGWPALLIAWPFRSWLSREQKETALKFTANAWQAYRGNSADERKDHRKAVIDSERTFSLFSSPHSTRGLGSEARAGIPIDWWERKTKTKTWVVSCHRASLDDDLTSRMAARQGG